MSDPVMDVDQHLRSPLGPLRGEPPPAPAWFTDAVGQEPERGLLTVEGAGIEMLVWGERGRPGLLFLHGGRAHGDWWDHVAPFFAGQYRVAALSMSGAGGSDWRERYSIAQLAREMAAVARAAGLHERGPPVYVAHSFGSFPLLAACADAELAPGAAVVLDMAIAPPSASGWNPRPASPSRVFPDIAAALARFRLLPAQPCDNLFILDHIARRSLKAVEGGWTWRFDPYFHERVNGESRRGADTALRSARCPLAFVYGGRSEIVRQSNLAYTRSVAPAGTRFTCIPEAGHHLFLDHPLRFVEVLKGELAALAA